MHVQIAHRVGQMKLSSISCLEIKDKVQVFLEGQKNLKECSKLIVDKVNFKSKGGFCHTVLPSKKNWTVKKPSSVEIENYKLFLKLMGCKNRIPIRPDLSMILTL